MAAEFEKKVSVIIPVYNVEAYLSGCLDSLVNQTIDKSQMEVILVNDSSTDSSLEICNEYAEKYPFFHVFTTPNGGCSRARNFALEHVQGKYIFYLDSDDTYTINVLKDVSEFFDEHYDEVDLVTFKIVPVFKGKRKRVHYRYKTLTETGVYDLTDDENIFISQTNVDIAVKNLGDENILFDTTPNFRQEDQKYCMDILRSKMKIGYVDGCEYLYESNPQSIVSTFSPLTLFDATTAKWEEIFASFPDGVPKYFQALFVNDILWKLQADILLPYHLEGKDYDDGVARIKNLLKMVDNDVILKHPDGKLMNKFYFIKMKNGDSIKLETGDMLRLTCGEETIYETENVLIAISKFKIHSNGKLEICGHLFSPVLIFSSKPEMYVNLNGKLIDTDLYDSSFCYSMAKVRNNNAWGFRFVFDTTEDISFGFKVLLDGKEIETDILCGGWVPFNKAVNNNEIVIDNKKCTLTDSRFVIKNIDEKQSRKFKLKKAFSFFPKKLKVFLVRLLNLIIPFGRVWLYHDCKTSPKDNGYYQFIHDFQIKDGVKRYYVVNGNIDDVRKNFTPEQQKYLVEFRSYRHKFLYLAAEKVITAFIEKVNYIPFFDDIYKYYMDLFTADVIYLQHGVLHAHTPWKYSYDRLNVTAEVISTHYEVENFTKNYCFPETALIKSKMPRYDFVDIQDNNSRRILLAPSWRKYLIKLAGDGSWIPTPDKFLNSDYYKRTMEFLNSDELYTLLEENDWYLDFKPHPIFSVYNDYFVTTNPRVNIPESADISDYKVLITDYSSFVFDFVYLERAIVYFLPDYREFKAGLNDYREVDLPFEDGFGEFTQNKDEAVAALKKIIENNGKAVAPFDERNAGFFFNKEQNSRDKIYEAVTGNFA